MIPAAAAIGRQDCPSSGTASASPDIRQKAAWRAKVKSDFLRHRVFLVDEAPCVLAGMRSIIETDIGLRVVGTARGGAEALAGTKRARPDLVVIDPDMIGVDGFELIEAIHRAVPSTRTMVFTRSEEPSLMKRAINLGAGGFVSKRCETQELMHAMKAILSGGVYLDPRIAARLLGLSASDSPAISLSARELEVIKLVAKGFCNKEISIQLSLSIKTVETYRARALEKLGTGTRARLVDLAVHEGWMVA